MHRTNKVSQVEMLLIISEGLDAKFEKEKSKKSPKTFSKEKVIYNRMSCI